MPTCICSTNQNLYNSKHHYWTLLVTSIHNLDWLPMPCENYGLKVRASHLNGNIGLDLQPMCNMTKIIHFILLEECKKRIRQQRFDPNWHGCKNMANPIERVTQLTKGCKTWQTLLKEHLYTHAQIWVWIRVFN